MLNHHTPCPLCAAFLGLFAFWRCGSTAHVPYASCKTGWTSCLDCRRGQMVTARIVTKNKFTAENWEHFHGWLFEEFFTNVSECHTCISKCNNSVQMSTASRFRACWCASQAVLLVAQELRSRFKLQHHKRSRRRPNKRWNQCFASQVHYVAPETWNDAS